MSRKRHRDRGEARFAARRAQIGTALITGDGGALESCLTEATKDLDAQVDLALTLDAIWPKSHWGEMTRAGFETPATPGGDQIPSPTASV